MIDQKLAQFFQYEKDDAIINLLVTARFVCSHAMNGEIIDRILALVKIDIPAPLFLKHLDELIVKYKKERKTPLYLAKMKRSPGFLQEDTIAWLYYALYWALHLENEEIKVTEAYAFRISQIVLYYHYYYLRYKKEEREEFKDPKKHQGESFFEEIAQSLSRAIEYLSKMAEEDSAYLNEMYFDIKEEDIGKHFLKMATRDIVETNHFFIMKNEPKDENYLLYENDFEEIKLQVLPSRKIQSGTNKKSERNQNIVSFFKDGLIAYQKLIELEFKGSRLEGKGRGGENYDRQYTEGEELLKDSYIEDRRMSTEAQHEEEQEMLQKRRIKHRVSTDIDQEAAIPNRYKQQKINRAFSANITKRLLMLPTAYEVPPKEHLAAFITSLCDEPLNGAYLETDLFRVIFIIGSVTGYEYQRTVDLLFEEGKHAELDLNEGTITIKLDNTLFAKEKKNRYLDKSSKKITYTIPPLMIMLIRKMKLSTEMAEVVEPDILKSDENFKRYIAFIKDRAEVFDSSIMINPEQLWRIVETYKKENYKEDMSALFCVGKYQTNDRPRLAYASTHKEGQIHASFVQQLFQELGLDRAVSSLIGLSPGLFKTTIKTDHHKHYSGSHRAVSKEVSERFFKYLKSLIKREDDEIVKFNLLAVYTKYALSLLLGTRSFEHSTYLGKISFAMHLLTLSEKSITLLSGARVIPLCERAEQIIKYYQKECMRLEIPKDHIYLIKEDKPQIYKKGLTVEVLSHHRIDSEIMEFVSKVPVNTGRHVITKLAMETNFNGHYLEAFLGHYGSGAEQFGIFSTLNSREYIQKCRELTQKVAMIYGVEQL